MLLTILGIVAFTGAASEAYDRLSTDHFLTDFAFPTFHDWKPVVWLGIFSIIGQLWNIGIFEIVRRRLDTNSHRAVARALTVSTALLVVCYLGFALVGNLALAVVASIGVRTFRNINSPLQTAWINQHVDSRVRATVISISSQADAIGQIAGGPVVGYVGVLAIGPRRPRRRRLHPLPRTLPLRSDPPPRGPDHRRRGGGPIVHIVAIPHPRPLSIAH